MIKIAVADDHPLVLRGIQQTLEEANGFKLTVSATSGKELLKILDKKTVDMVLLDISMPDGDGIDILKKIKRKFPEMPVLILSIHPEDQYAVRCIRAGAAGFISKAAAPEDLLQALKDVAETGKYISREVASQLANHIRFGDDKGPLHEKLSHREFQVFIALAQGKAIMDIGKELNLSEKTISTYRARLLEKMHMTNNAEVVRYALDNRLIR